jgi:hypothetical protein
VVKEVTGRLLQYAGYHAAARYGQPLVLWSVLFVYAGAAQPVAVISGQTYSAPAPGVLLLSSAGSSYNVGDLIWVVADSSIQAMEGKDGRIALFYMGTQPITSKVLLIAIASDGTTASMAMDSKSVSFGGSVPPNPVPPTPVPPVPPPNPAPPDVFHLAAVATSAGGQLPAAAKALLPAIADNFTAATGTTLVGLNTDVFQRNQKTMGTIKPLFAPLSDALQSALQAAAITTLAQGQQAFAEIAWGLRQVK